MPEFTAIQIGLLALMLVCGGLVGWIVRSDRCAKEKIAVRAGWQEQLESQQLEHDRLAGQNKSLMDQVSQYQAAQKDSTNRARELSDSLREAFAHRDELQRQLKDARSQFDVAVAQRDRLKDTLRSKKVVGQSAAIKQKDDKIFRLSRELTSWQSRVPPLVERYRIRDREAAAAQAHVTELQERLQEFTDSAAELQELQARVRELEETESELKRARARLQDLADAESELQMLRAKLQRLEKRDDSDETRIEPLDADSLPDGGDASNEPNAMTTEPDFLGFDDQIDQLDGSNDMLLTPLDEFAPSIDETRDLADIDADETIAAVFGELQENDFTAAETNLQSGATQSIGKHYEDDLEPAEPESWEEPAEPENQGPETLRIEKPPINANGCDDLQKIKGVGPSIEQLLNNLGIFSFRQIAVMTESEIDQVAEQLKGFRSRIYREDWIGQARDLEYQKNNDPA